MASKENRSEATVSGADGINKGENLDPIGEGLDDHHGNLDQGLSSAMEEKAASVEAEASLYPLLKGITAALEEGVSQMKMQLDDGELNLAARGPCSRERVSMSSDYGLSGEETPQHSAGIVFGVVNQDVKSPGGQSKKKQWVPTRETDRAVKAKSLSIGRDISKPRKITVRLSADAVEAPSDLVRWEAPPQGWAKINVDGAFVQQIGEAGTGIVIRDHVGDVLLTSWNVIRSCQSPEEAEAQACRDGLRLAADWIQMPVILESDCANVVASLTSGAKNRSPLWQVFQEIKSILPLLPAFKFNRINRGANEVAHCLSQLARRLKQSSVWRMCAPECVKESLAKDCIPPNL
uniref:RNase H type-1 domain-containing protein n=1 Tax=Oryza glumipatula TaxID=40148 RepID=A0A0D9YAJ6_9ORYZ